MINLNNITSQDPAVVLRGEYGIALEDSLIIAPNAKNGKIVILIDAEKQIAAIAHFDASEKVEENLSNILSEMSHLGAEIKNTKCSIMEKESAHSLKDKLHKSFKEKIEAVLKEKGNESEVNHTAWSGNDFCNVVLSGTGETIIDNTPELMRAALNLLIFSVEGDQRLNNALNPALITELKKIKSSTVKHQVTQQVTVIKEKPSTIFLKLGISRFGRNNDKDQSRS